MNTNLAYELSITEGKTTFDTQCKKILSHKIILAWILKYAVSEFSELTITEIYNCIEDTPTISSIGVLPGSSNSEKIAGMTTENKIQDEGAIYYDIRFSTTIPTKAKSIRLLINLEAQKAFSPGYQIVTRGFFYDTRMISAQLGTEFSIPHYNGIKKVYSIWICMAAPNYIGNAISEYHITKEDKVPGIPKRPWTYDKLSVVIIALNEKRKTDHKLLRLLKTLFSDKPYSEKKKILEQEYSIYLEGKELKHMCNLSEYIEERGLEKGQTIAKQKFIENLLKMKVLSDAAIAAAAECTLEKIQMIKQELYN